MAFTLKLTRGATLDRTLTWWLVQGVTPRDLTGYTMRLQVRTNPSQPPIIDVATGSGITLAPASGIFRIVVSAAATTLLTSGTYSYDLKVTDAGGTVSYPLGGPFMVSDPVTP